MRNPIDRWCWRCKQVQVRVFGVPCPECRRVLESEYEANVAANGGKLLHIPENWDGMVTKTCKNCKGPFDASVLNTQGRGEELCEPCRRELNIEGNRKWRAERRRPRPNDPVEIDFTRV